MSAASATARGQRLAESLQITPCVITREGGLGTDPITGASVHDPVRVWPAPGTHGYCQVVDADLQPHEEGRYPQIVSGGIVVKVPAAASDAGIRIGDLTQAGARRFTVRRVVAKTQMVVLRLLCDELPPLSVGDQ